MRVLAGDYMGFFLLVPCDDMGESWYCYHRITACDLPGGYYGPNQSMGYHRIRALLMTVLD